MAKIEIVKKPVSCKTSIKLLGHDDDLQVLEGYGTAKKRLYDINDFFEVTKRNGAKITLNKKVIENMRPID
jgi:hypothetical protein